MRARAGLVCTLLRRLRCVAEPRALLEVACKVCRLLSLDGAANKATPKLHVVATRPPPPASSPRCSVIFHSFNQYIRLTAPWNYIAVTGRLLWASCWAGLWAGLGWAAPARQLFTIVSLCTELSAALLFRSNYARPYPAYNRSLHVRRGGPRAAALQRLAV